MKRTYPIGVMIVDDHKAVRNGLATFLDAFEDLRLAGEASDGTEAMRLCREVLPDVVLMDLAMPGTDSIATIRAIREAHPQVQVIGLISYADQHRASEALAAGAICCLRKDTPIDLMARAIRAASQERPSNPAEDGDRPPP